MQGEARESEGLEYQDARPAAMAREAMVRAGVWIAVVMGLFAAACATSAALIVFAAD